MLLHVWLHIIGRVAPTLSIVLYNPDDRFWTASLRCAVQIYAKYFAAKLTTFSFIAQNSIAQRFTVLAVATKVEYSPFQRLQD